MLTTWKKELEEALNGEKLIYCTIDEEELNREFDNSYGCENGSYFTAWSEKHVYFPLCYDGSEWVGCAPRNPCDISLKHQGGG